MIQIDMPMPMDCEECPLTYPIHDGGAEYCCLTDVPEYIYRYGERPAECPLREVSESDKDKYVARLEHELAKALCKTARE